MRITHRVLTACLLSFSTSIFAAAPAASAYGSSVTNDLNSLTEYLQNLGRYFGYDVTQYCATGGPCSNNSSSGSNYSNLLLNANDSYMVQLNLYNSYVGALLGGGTTNTMTSVPLVPTNTPGYAILNTLAGQTYITPPYATPSSQTISVSPLMDQKQYQVDPVSQYVLNILSTPNISYCYDNTAEKIIPNCPYLFREKVMENVLGELPGTQVVFSSAYNKHIVPQLNGNNFLSPLLYSTTALEQENNNQGEQNSQRNKGLPALTQAQQAENFIRYATGAVNPLFLPERKTYDNLIIKAGNYSKDISQKDQATALATLNQYLLALRTYTAQVSVGTSNLYYMLSRRMPQKVVGTDNQGSTSQALNEFTLATWRLYNPSGSGDSGDSQWVNKINNASSATVQKEIAIMLSEINYQLYLQRQLDERILLTNSMLLLQSAQTNRPSGADLNSDSGAASTTGASPAS